MVDAVPTPKSFVCSSCLHVIVDGLGSVKLESPSFSEGSSQKERASATLSICSVISSSAILYVANRASPLYSMS